MRQTNNFTLWKRFHCGSFHATEKLWHYYRQQQPQRNLILVKRQRSSHTHHTRTDRLEEQPAAATSRRVSVEKTELEKKPEFYVWSTTFGPSEFGLMRHPRKSCRCRFRTSSDYLFTLLSNWCQLVCKLVAFSWMTKKIKILVLNTNAPKGGNSRTVSRIEQNCWKKMGNKDDIFHHARI